MKQLAQWNYSSSETLDQTLHFTAQKWGRRQRSACKSGTGGGGGMIHTIVTLLWLPPTL